MTHKTRNDPPEGSDVTCRACVETFKAGIFCFYRLCDVCFPKFDEQKTQSRLAIMRGQPATGTESVAQWLAKRKAAVEACARVHANFLKTLQALIEAEQKCVDLGVVPEQPLDPVVEHYAARWNATDFERRTLEWSCAISATTLINLKRTNAPPELLERCRRTLQQRVQGLPQYSDRTIDDLMALPSAPDTPA